MDEEQSLLQAVNLAYGTDFSAIKLLRSGGCISYCVSGCHGKYFMKKMPSTFADTAKQSLEILTYLEKYDFPSARVLPTKEGELSFLYQEQSDNYICALYEFIDGTEPAEGEGLEELGVLTAKLHNLMDGYKGDLAVHEKGFFIDRYMDTLGKKHYDPEKIARFREYGDQLWTRIESLPRGFCHGDLHRGNILETSSGAYYIMDFDTSCRAFPIYDIMILCNGTDYFHFKSGDFQKARYYYKRFLCGYTRYRALTDAETKAFYSLIAVYHYQLQATIIEIFGLDCVDDEFLDSQYNWLMKWEDQCKLNGAC